VNHYDSTSGVQFRPWRLSFPSGGAASSRHPSTAEAKWTFEANDEPIPEPGDHWVVLDGDGEPRCVIRTTAVEVVPFVDVTADHAAAEGEGDGSLAFWREAHVANYRRTLPEGRSFDREMPVVCERFEIVYHVRISAESMKNAVRKHRESHDLTQGEFASRVGVIRQSINAIERGRFGPSLEPGVKFAAGFDIPVDELFWLD
jgi:uncharacterized protein YhfF/DNA-binding XRE family transcriptional regulator